MNSFKLWLEHRTNFRYKDLNRISSWYICKKCEGLDSCLSWSDCYIKCNIYQAAKENKELPKERCKTPTILSKLHVQAIDDHFASGETIAPDFEELQGRVEYLRQKEWEQSEKIDDECLVEV